jgi:hypothetical protein
MVLRIVPAGAMASLAHGSVGLPDRLAPMSDSGRRPSGEYAA